MTWHFQGVPAQPYVGACGSVANWADPRRDPPALPQWLQAWMLQSLPLTLPGVGGPLLPQEDRVAREAFVAGMLYAGRLQFAM